MSEHIDSSSNNRQPGISDALVHRDQKIAGPVRLPPVRGDDFVSQFNRLYGHLGMTLEPNEAKKLSG